MPAKQESSYGPDGQPDLSHIAQYNAGYGNEYKSAEQYPYGYADSIVDDYHVPLEPIEWHDPLEYGYPDPGVGTSTTPQSTTASTGSKRTRSGRIIPRSDSPLSSAQSISGDSTGLSKSSKSPRKGRAKAIKETTLKLAAPLSALTKDWGPPLKDMEKWANRTVEERRKEAEQRGWKIARPMNRFMMYRSAYADKTKEWCKKNNHQVVSEITGQSWKKLEPKEIKDYYDRLATIERENHQKAFPDYKFSPAKANAKTNRKRRDLGYYDDGLSDNDPDGEWAPAGRHSKQRKQPPQQIPTSSYVPSQYPYGNPHGWTYPTQGSTSAATYNQIQQPYHGQDQMYIAQANPYHGQYNPYLQPQVQMYQPQPRAQEAPAVVPSMQQSSGSLVSLPGGQHHELLQSRNATPVPSYHQAQIEGNYADHSALLQPNHMAYVYDADSHEGDSEFQKAMNDIARAQGAIQSTVSDDPFLDPQLGGSIDNSPYQKYLSDE